MSVHREKYLDYDGPLDASYGWWTVAAQTVKSTVGYLRTKLIVPLLWLGPVIAAVLLVAQFFLQGQSAAPIEAPSGAGARGFIQLELFSLAVLYAVSCGRVVSHDLQYRTLELYFSKPIEDWEYSVGKWLGLVLVGALVTTGPAIGLGVLRVVLYAQHGLAGAVAADAAIGVGMTTLMTGVSAAVLLGLSSLTARTGFVVLAWVGAVFIPLVASGIIGLSSGASRYADLISLQGAVDELTGALYGMGSDPLPIWMGAGALLLWTAAGIGLHVWRLQHLEEIL